MKYIISKCLFKKKKSICVERMCGPQLQTTFCSKSAANGVVTHRQAM